MAKNNETSEEPKGLHRWTKQEKPADGGKAKKKAKRARRGRAPKKRVSSYTKAARRYAGTLIALAIILVACVIGFTPLGEKITQGLDIRGGVSVILSASKTDGSQPSSEDMQIATEIVQSRVNALGASETTVQQQGTNSILVQIPGATDADSTVKAIGQTGHLEFVRVSDIGDADALSLISNGKDDVKLNEGTYTSFMDGSHISSTSVAQANNSSSGSFAVNIQLDDEGKKTFGDVTTELAPTKGQIAIVLDGVIKSAPAVQTAITEGQVSITGDFSSAEARALKTVLDSGSLPVTLTYSESRVVGPTLGQDSLNQGVFAIGLGACIVIVYLFFFYRGMGILTMGSLAVFGIIYLGLLALLSHFGAFALTLPGLAGVVLTTGSAADSSILVLERFREEIRMGRSIRNASVSGAKHGIRTSLDADAVTLVTALALFFFAVGTVKGFGLTLALGIVCDVLTMFLFKAPALRLLAIKAIPSHPGFWGVKQDIEEAEAAKGDADAKEGGVANA